MEPWSYCPEGKGVFFSNEIDLPIDSFTRNPKFTSEWNQKPSNCMENSVFMSELADRCFSDTVTKPFCDLSVNSHIKLASSCLDPSNLLSEENESSSEFPNLHHQEVTDYKNSSNIVFGNDTSVISPPAKKSRASSLISQTPLCQVYGCNMDLSSSKDYHRRHRVCEAHSKTPVVIVNGIEQRFCQQCSRFHLLREFDDRKRSCRRRLAGHNERRRKPSFYFLPSRGHRVLRSSQGNKFLSPSWGEDFSLIFPGAYPANRMCKDHRASRVIKFEDESMTRCPQTSIFSVNALISSADQTTIGSSSTCALSLLSSQSHMSGSTFPTGRREDNVTNEDQMESLLIDCGKSIESGSCLSNGKGASTVDLFQLSSHLRRVEHQRNNSSQVKQECKELHYLLGSS